MTTITAYTASGRAVSVRADWCGFPRCEETPVTTTGMCDKHRRVSVSTTGSWLETG